MAKDNTQRGSNPSLYQSFWAMASDVYREGQVVTLQGIPYWLSGGERCDYFRLQESMHCWNRNNFEGLLELARELKQTPDLAVLSEYCVLRENPSSPQDRSR
jgi:hypothetical protein